MHYPIPASPQDMIALQQQTVDEELVVAAIAGVIRIARSQGQTLEDLTAEVLQEDYLLDVAQRRWLSQVVAHAWERLS